MKKTVWVLGMIALTVTLLCAQAAEDDAYTLKNWLTTEFGKGEGSFGNYMWASGYLAGLEDAGEGYLFCLPTAKRGEFQEVVVKYMRDHPNRLHEGRSLVAAQALADAYPCKKK